MTDKLKLRPEGETVTQKVFDRLPALLTPYQVKMITGMDDRELADEVKAGRLKPWLKPKRAGRRRAYNKFRKVDVAGLVGFTI